MPHSHQVACICLNILLAPLKIVRCRCVRCSCGHSRIIFSYHYCTHSTQLLASKNKRLCHITCCFVTCVPICQFRILLKRLHLAENRFGSHGVKQNVYILIPLLSNVTRIVLMFSSCDVMVSTQKRKIQFYLANCFNGRRNNSGKLEMNDFDFRQLIYFDFPLLSFVLKRNRTIGTMECSNDDRMRSTGKPTAFNFQVFRSLTGKAPD